MCCICSVEECFSDVSKNKVLVVNFIRPYRKNWTRVGPSSESVVGGEFLRDRQSYRTDVPRGGGVLNCTFFRSDPVSLLPPDRVGSVRVPDTILLRFVSISFHTVWTFSSVHGPASFLLSSCGIYVGGKHWVLNPPPLSKTWISFSVCVWGLLVYWSNHVV